MFPRMTIPQSRHVDVVRTHLEMRDISALRRVDASVPGVTLIRHVPSGAEYRALYTAVGGTWWWRDRLQLSDGELDAHFASEDVALWLLRAGPDVAGFFEFQRHGDGRVEIMYFGLMPAHIGRGLGGWMLTRAVEEAFALCASHVTLHTCTLDSPAALPNYLARGFVIVREETYVEDIPIDSA